MLRARCFPAFAASFVVATVLAGPVRVVAAEHSGALFEVPVPGGLRAALAAIDDRVVPDRSQFLREFIRRTYQTPAGAKHGQREAALRTLLVHLELAGRSPATPAGETPDTLPLPLAPPIWIDVVFGGRSSLQTLVADIVQARGPSLLYYGLLSLDEETRAWLATKPDLIRELATLHSAGFAVAAPGLRVVGDSLRLPGDELAVAAWEALAGRRATDPVGFVRAIVADRERRLPYFLSAMAQLTPAQAAYALNLHAADPASSTDAMRRMHDVFLRVAPGWKIDDRVFWRPAMDPALLVGDLQPDGDGRPVVPGTRRFWTAAFADGDPKAGDEDPGALADGEAVEFVWLCEQIFGGDQRRRYPTVLFASRVIGPLTTDSALDALEAVRAVGRYPALVATLERAGIRDLAVFAAAARRAGRLSAIEDEGRASRALTQFQAALAIVTRAARRGSVAAEALPALLTSLAAVEVSARGEYEGRMVRWLDGLLRETGAADGPDEDHPDPVARALVLMLAGPSRSPVQSVEWEGTRYRVDLQHTELMRLGRLLGEDSKPYLSSARALIDAADALGDPGLTRERLAREVARVEHVAQALGGDWQAPLQRLGRAADVRGASRFGTSLRPIADEMLARGLIEITYAVALGHPDRATIAASDAASRHDFGLALGAIRRLAPWRFPAAGASVGREWHVTGSLLGLDVKLADFSLVAISSKPPPRRPMVPDEDRRVFIEAVALADSAALTDEDRDAIASAVGAGRGRLAALDTPAAAALAEEIGLSAARRSLLTWVVTHDRQALSRFLSHGELLALGSPNKALSARLNAWGAPAEPRLGCLCLRLFDRRQWQSVEGRWNSGIMATAFPDLSLRLAELLSELRMPAALLPAVLAPATLEFINTAECRDPDDRRGLLDFVQRLRSDRVEQYLALLTSDGPLVPIIDGSSEVER